MIKKAQSKKGNKHNFTFLFFIFIVLNPSVFSKTATHSIYALYQRVRNPFTNTRAIYRYNDFQQAYVKEGQLQGAIASSLTNSAYNVVTQHTFFGPIPGSFLINEYNLTNNFSFVRSIIIYLATIPTIEIIITGALKPVDYLRIGDEIDGVELATLKDINFNNSNMAVYIDTTGDIIKDASDVDSDGDGVTDEQEGIDGTDSLDSCDFKPKSITLSQSQLFLDGDCDGDGLSNGKEIGENSMSPYDSDNDGVSDYLEFNTTIPSGDTDIEVFQFLTPNGDGDNDVLIIGNIQQYPDNTVEIYNRWGILVYETKGYGQNENYFRGISEGRVTINQRSELPAGTYYYVVKCKDSLGTAKKYSGYLYINK